MMKFESVAKVGDYIRAYDFKPMKGRTDVFIEGTIEAVTNEPGYKAFKVKCERDFCGNDGDLKAGDFSRIGKTIFVPMQVSFMEYDARIINLSA